MSHPAYYVICDLDGCLSDDRWRRHLLPGNPTRQEDWTMYHKRCGDDDLVRATFNQVVNCCMDDATGKQKALLLIVTARPIEFSIRAATEWWLHKHFGNLKRMVIMRPLECLAPSPEFKRRALEDYFNAEFGGNSSEGWSKVVAAFDDRADVLEAFPIREDAKRQVILDGPPARPSQVAEALDAMAKTARERAGVYGDAYLAFGRLATALWPEGITIKTEEDFVRHGVLMHVLNKVLRYASVEGGHKDSAHDLAVYAAMLESVTK